MAIVRVLFIFVGVISVFFAYWVISTMKKEGKLGGGIKKNLSKEAALKAAQKRLIKNPRDPYSLFIVGENFFENSDWSNAFNIFETLADIPNTNQTVEMPIVNLRAAVCAINMNMMDVAYKFIVVAHNMAPSNFEISYQMGFIEFSKKNYEKALTYLQQSLTLNSEYAPTLRILGHTYFKLKRNKEAMTYIHRAIDLAHDDKESLFTLAQCYSESGQKDQALRIYTHLRPDPVWGAEACLYSGNNKAELHQDESAIEDYLIGLKHSNIKQNIDIELKYQLGTAFLRLQKIGESITYLQQVKELDPNYKDCVQLINKYKELNANKNLQIFIMAPSAEFVTLCRKVTLGYFPNAKVKITKTLVSGNDWVDIVAEVDTQKWSDVVMFRFIRTQGVIGELVLRDFHSHLKEVKAGKGICVAVGTYSDEAKRFTEARLIDLIDRPRFAPILNNIDSAIKNVIRK